MPASAPPGGPAYVDVFGGETADLDAFYAGRVGIVMASSPRSHLFMDWRLLHGQAVGAAAGAPGCRSPAATQPDAVNGDDPTPGCRPASPTSTLRREGSTSRPSATWATAPPRPTAIGDAFRTAIATLKDRSAQYGADSPWVKAWVAGQDAVFDGCHNAGVAMPALDPAAPAWLKADHAYQAAALSTFYLADYDAAAVDFAAIGRDAASPWRASALYLVGRPAAPGQPEPRP